MISASDLRLYVIAPALAHLAQWNRRLDSEAAVRLLLMTAGHESTMRGETRLHQVNGPAVGIYQMEPATADDLLGWVNVQPNELDERLRELLCWGPIVNQPLDINQMHGNLYYATAMARLLYWRRPEPLPDKDDIPGLASYAKQWWNTPLGKATVADYITAYARAEQRA